VERDRDVTRLLADLSAGRNEAGEELFSVVYDELRALARRHMQHERGGHTLQTTALVHEAYLRLGGEHTAPWESRAHFLRVASRAMRRVLVDSARARKAQKRGGGFGQLGLDKETPGSFGDPPLDLIALDEALCELAEFDPRMSRIVELRFFAGLTGDETAKVLEVSPRTVDSDWRLARIWLRKALTKREQG